MEVRAYASSFTRHNTFYTMQHSVKTQDFLLMAAMSVLPLTAQTPAPTAPAPAPAAADFSELSRREFSLWLGYESGWFVAQNIPDGQCDANAACVA